MQLRREHIISEECEKGGLYLPPEVIRKVMSYVFPGEHDVKRICVRVDCNEIAAPNPDPRFRKGNKHDNFTCNNAECGRKCAWYERVGDTLVRCDAARKTNNKGAVELFCAGSWCKGLYKRNGGRGKEAFERIKRTRQDDNEVFA